MFRFRVLFFFLFIDTNWLSLTSSNLSLTPAEKNYLYSMTSSFLFGDLMYRASRDGFAGTAFHDRCDNVPNTVTIIRNALNFVFGGFTAARWTSNNSYIADPTAFIFSLRRNGISNNYRLPINSTQVNNAIYGNPSYGPTFGNGPDIIIYDKSNINTGRFSNIRSYIPPTYPSGSNGSLFLTGGLYNWLTTEIEVTIYITK